MCLWTERGSSLPRRLVSMRLRFCHIHGNLEDICGINTCHANCLQESRACPLHQGLYSQYIERRKSIRQKILMYIREMRETGPMRLPKEIRDGLEENIALEIDALLAANPQGITAEAFVEQISRKVDAMMQAQIGIRHQFGRATTEMELFVVKSCGHFVNRKTCFRSETLHNVLVMLLIATNGGRDAAPTHLYYDRACAFNHNMEHLMEQQLQHAVPVAIRTSRPTLVYNLNDVARLY